MKITRSVTWILLGVTLCAAFLVGIVFAQNGDASTASVVYIDGFVDVRYAGTEEWVSLPESAVLSVGDEIETDTESEVILALPDGSKVKIGSSSRVLIKELGLLEITNVSKTTLEVVSGKIRAAVTPFVSKESSFTVETENVSIGVRGTDFGVIFDPDTFVTTIISIQDCVEVVSTNYPMLDAVMVCTSEELLVSADGMPGEVLGVDAEKLLEFLEEMRFQGEGAGGEGAGFPPEVVRAILNGTINLEDVEEGILLLRDSLTPRGTVEIVGDAEDDEYDIVKVEYSLDAGFTWHEAEGTTHWSFEYVPDHLMVYEVMVRATNDAGLVSDPMDFGPWMITYWDLTYEQVGWEYVEAFFEVLETGDLSALEDLISDDYLGSAGGYFSKEELISAIEEFLASNPGAVFSYTIDRVYKGSVIITVTWQLSLHGRTWDGVVTFWLSEEDGFALVKTEGDLEFPTYVPSGLPAGLTVQEIFWPEPYPCNRGMAVLLIAPNIPSDVMEVTIIAADSTCGTFYYLTLTRDYYLAETGYLDGFGGVFALYDDFNCGNPVSCFAPFASYNGLFEPAEVIVTFNGYGYNFVQILELF
ncbi:MAG: FecR domain-containing protein [Deltaproteobacteria bacterium]|nr:FecR domain-containing protein [Candidatus Zymogenaceae bacterium]